VFEQHIFTSNLKRQILLDSVQGRSPNLAFLPVASVPELEVLVETWAFFETIHSRSYTHIIRNIYANPSKVFDEISTIQPILDCAHDISKYYDDFINYRRYYELLGVGVHTVNGQTIIYQPIKNLTQIQQQYNPNNIVSLQATSDKYFQNFSIKFDDKVPSNPTGPSGEHVYIDPETGELVVEAVNLEPDEQIEIEITVSGIIYEAVI
jgi:hypothetical protein